MLAMGCGPGEEEPPPELGASALRDEYLGRYPAGSPVAALERRLGEDGYSCGEANTVRGDEPPRGRHSSEPSYSATGATPFLRADRTRDLYIVYCERRRREVSCGDGWVERLLCPTDPTRDRVGVEILFFDEAIEDVHVIIS